MSPYSTTRAETDWLPKPKAGSVKLKPAFVRSHHLGPVTRPHAVARLERDAQLVYLAATMPLTEAQRAGKI